MQLYVLKLNTAGKDNIGQYNKKLLSYDKKVSLYTAVKDNSNLLRANLPIFGT